MLSDELCDELFDEVFDELSCKQFELLKIGLKNAAPGQRRRAAFSTPQSQFFTKRTDPKPANKLFIFFPSISQSIFSFFHFHPHKHAALYKCSKLTHFVKRNFFILILQ